MMNCGFCSNRLSYWYVQCLHFKKKSCTNNKDKQEDIRYHSPNELKPLIRIMGFSFKNIGIRRRWNKSPQLAQQQHEMYKDSQLLSSPSVHNLSSNNSKTIGQNQQHHTDFQYLLHFIHSILNDPVLFSRSLLLLLIIGFIICVICYYVNLWVLHLTSIRTLFGLFTWVRYSEVSRIPGIVKGLFDIINA